jgi:hypothetical protein
VDQALEDVDNASVDNIAAIEQAAVERIAGAI